MESLKKITRMPVGTLALLVLLPTLCLMATRPVGNDKYVIDKESVVQWKCSMVLGNNGHYGFVSVSKGELTTANGQLVAGSVEIDMNTIADEAHKTKNGLVDHLKSPDFFDVETFPTATFVISRVTPAFDGSVNVTGKLTIKGVTNDVTFPAKIETKQGIITTNGKLIIDRTQWNVRYKSGRFFDNLADEAISDSIEFDLKIVAKK